MAKIYLFLIKLLFLNSVFCRPKPQQIYEISFENQKQNQNLDSNRISFDKNDIALDYGNIDSFKEECVPGMEDMPQFQRSSKDNIVVMFDDAVILALPDCDPSKVPNNCEPKPTRNVGLVAPPTTTDNISTEETIDLDQSNF